MANIVGAHPSLGNFKHQAMLQRGGKVFINYCSGCHSLKYLRYGQMAKDLGLTHFDRRKGDSLLWTNLVFTKASLHQPIKAALRPQDALQWFSAEPPDLSLVVRQHGAAWLREYLKSFYQDAARPFGSNNLLSPMVAMPNVLEILSGTQVRKQNGQLQALHDGCMTATEFETLVSDLVGFLSYVSEPEKAERQKIGYIVLGFLMLFALVLFLLQREIWRELPKRQ